MFIVCVLLSVCFGRGYGEYEEEPYERESYGEESYDYKAPQSSWTPTQSQGQRLTPKGPISEIIAEGLDEVSEQQMQNMLQLPRTLKGMTAWHPTSIHEISGSKANMIKNIEENIKDRLDEVDRYLYSELEPTIHLIVEGQYHDLKTKVLTRFAAETVGKTKQRLEKELQGLKKRKKAVIQRRGEIHKRHMKAEGEALEREEKLAQQISALSGEKTPRQEHHRKILEEQKTDLEEELARLKKSDDKKQKEIESIDKQLDQKNDQVQHLSEIEDMVSEAIGGREPSHKQTAWKRILDFEKKRQTAEEKDKKTKEDKKRKREESEQAAEEKEKQQSQSVLETVTGLSKKAKGDGETEAQAEQNVFGALGKLFGG